MKFNNLLKQFGITAFLGIMILSANAQQSEVLLTVGNNKITKQEFETLFKKNNLKDSEKADDKVLNEYLDLYIKFRLKVKEAEVRGLDTSAAFKKELDGYRKTLAQPYLIDKSVTDQLIMEAYKRSLVEIEASHILIGCSPDASPKDTLAAYNKIINLRNRIVNNKEDFGSIAQKYSDDPSAKENKGDLGYFSSFTMVYSFEAAAYNLGDGEVSMPVKTKYGYHLIKKTNSRPAQGEITVEHIMVRTPKNMTAIDSVKIKTKIDSIYARVKAGESFEELAKQFSDDKVSGKQGGKLQSFGTGKMVESFEDAAFALGKNGDVSAPVRTEYGWHIIKRIDKKPLPVFEEVKNEIKTKVSKDSRSELNKQSFYTKLRKEYNLIEVLDAKKEFYKVKDSIFLKGQWKAGFANGMNKLMFSFANQKVYQSEFATFMEEKQYMVNKTSMESAVNKIYEMFVNSKLEAYEESILEKKYPEFKALMQEYRDGILLFDLTDEMVWSKAVKDTIGLQNYFEANNKNYKWNERLDATIYSSRTAEIAAEVRKLYKNKKISSDSLLSRINQSNPLNLTIKEGKFEKGENTIIDGIEWKKGVTKDIIIPNAVVFVVVKEKIPTTLKNLNEVRGAATADYQNYLEDKWIEELRAKYPVNVDTRVLKSMIN